MGFIMNHQKIQALRTLLQENNNKFFTVEFIKKNGEQRKINGHIRYVAGHDGQNPVAHLPQYVTVVLSQKEDNKPVFRNVNLDTVTAISINKQRYTF